MKLNVQDPTKFIRLKDHFTLHDSDNRIIGRSPVMTEPEMKEAIDLLVKYGADAPVIWE